MYSLDRILYIVKKTVSHISIRVSILSFIIIIVSCKTVEKSVIAPVDQPVYNFVKFKEVNNAAVVTAHPEASKIGLEILRKGGNAADAAIAVQFALAVCYPVAGNIGGGGFMVYRSAAGDINALDFREKAPGQAFTDMYLDTEGNPISELSTAGHLAAGVPGSVDGMWEVFQKYSQLKDWKTLVQPSVDLARNGFKLTKKQASSLNNKREDFIKYNTVGSQFVAKETWRAGDDFVQADLAKTFEAIRDKGRDGFYEGWVADKIVEEMKRGNGIINHQDLSDYNSVWREPVVGSYKDLKIISMPPPSSGGLILLQLLKMVEPFELGNYGLHSSQAVHTMVEAERRAYADRATHLGDMDFYPVPSSDLINNEYIQSRMDNFDMDKASKSDDIAAGVFEESEQTTHFSIVDQEGNAVSITTTINTGFGNKVIVGGAGFLLNNEMDDFSAKPGTPNYFGLIGAEANKIEPGKRMLSSMTPTIIEQNGNLKMVVGTPGGSTIITSVYQVIMNVFEFNTTAFDAVQLPRFHHQWKPDLIMYEDDFMPEDLSIKLATKGHELKKRGKIGRVEVIYVNDSGRLEAVADSRGDDHVSGY